MTEGPVPRSRRFLDRDFRWRGTDVTRMEAFGDAVFALVLALLFLRAVPPQTIGELMATMKGLLPFAITFALLAMVWIDHHRYFRRYGLVDRTTFFGNLWLLFLVMVYAYPLKFLFTLLCVLWLGPIGELTAETMGAVTTSADVERMMLFYGAGFGAIYATFALLYRHALRRTDLQLDAVERHMTVTTLLESTTLVGFAVVSMLLALLGMPRESGLVYFGVGPAMTVLGWRRGRAQAALVAARELSALPAPG